jgi:excisionase family DNA binding protein
VEHTSATAEQPQYLTVAEVSSRFRVSVPTIYRRCADGTLPHIRIGSDGPIRIPTSQLERLYEQGVSVDGSPAGGSFAGADPVERRANRQAFEAKGREDEKRRLRPPPIGLSVTN